MSEPTMTDEELAEVRREVRRRANTPGGNTETHTYTVFARTISSERNRFGPGYRTHGRRWALRAPVDAVGHPTFDELHDRFVAGDPDVDEWDQWWGFDQ